MAWGLTNISSHELSEWMAYDAVEPIGGKRLDYLFAFLMAILVNLHKGKGDTPAELDDFLIDYWAYGPEESEPQSIEEQRAMLQMLKAVFEGKR